MTAFVLGDDNCLNQHSAPARPSLAWRQCAHRIMARHVLTKLGVTATGPTSSPVANAWLGGQIRFTPVPRCSLAKVVGAALAG